MRLSTYLLISKSMVRFFSWEMKTLPALMFKPVVSIVKNLLHDTTLGSILVVRGIVFILSPWNGRGRRGPNFSLVKSKQSKKSSISFSTAGLSTIFCLSSKKNKHFHSMTCIKATCLWNGKIGSLLVGFEQPQRTRLLNSNSESQ